MSEKNSKKLSDLPESTDLEFWGEGQRFSHRAKPVKICYYHKGNEWMKYQGYTDNHDGTVSCQWCSWGSRIPGYLKVISGRVMDLRNLKRE